MILENDYPKALENESLRLKNLSEIATKNTQQAYLNIDIIIDKNKKGLRKGFVIPVNTELLSEGFRELKSSYNDLMTIKENIDTLQDTANSYGEMLSNPINYFSDADAEDITGVLEVWGSIQVVGEVAGVLGRMASGVGKFIASFFDSSIHIGKDIPSKKLQNALTAHRLKNEEDVLILVDNTKLGSATNSVLFTFKGVSINYEKTNFFLLWEDIGVPQIVVQDKTSYIKIANRKILLSQFFNGKEKILINLIQFMGLIKIQCMNIVRFEIANIKLEANSKKIKTILTDKNITAKKKYDFLDFYTFEKLHNSFFMSNLSYSNSDDFVLVLLYKIELIVEAKIGYLNRINIFEILNTIYQLGFDTKKSIIQKSINEIQGIDNYNNFTSIFDSCQELIIFIQNINVLESRDKYYKMIDIIRPSKELFADNIVTLQAEMDVKISELKEKQRKANKLYLTIGGISLLILFIIYLISFFLI